ncbi:DUF4055 domain-containing protein [Pseudescherichia vulneris]
MPLDTERKEYSAMVPLWRRARRVIEGEEAVKDAGKSLLPKLGGQDEVEYEAYKHRATFFNATGRTASALKGVIMDTPPICDLPAELKSYESNMDGEGAALQVVAERFIRELVDEGRAGIGIDIVGGRPVLNIYKTEEIINWRGSKVKGETRELCLATTRSPIAIEDKEDPFSTVIAQEYIGRYLDRESGALHVRRQVVGDKEKRDAEVLSMTYPDGKPLDFVPLVICGLMGPELDEPGKPTLNDLININIAHYRNSADYEHGLHYVGMPTAVVIGVSSTPFPQDGPGDQKQNAYRIGADTVWEIPLNGDAKYLEFTGQGLENYVTAMREKEAQMAVLGSRILAPEKRQAEAAETASIHRASEHATVADIAHSASDAMSLALSMAYHWLTGKTKEIVFKFNDDYAPKGLTAQEITALTKAYQAGSISFETFWQSMKDGGVKMAGDTPEEEMALIQSGANNAMGGLGGGQSKQPGNPDTGNSGGGD